MADISGTTNQDKSIQDTSSKGQTGSQEQYGTGSQGQHGQTGARGQYGQTGTQAQSGQIAAQGQYGQGGLSEYGQTGIQGQSGHGHYDQTVRMAGAMGEISAERAHTAKIAQNLSVLAFRQWEKALTGIFSLPAAVTLGAAATALYTAAFLERAFELFEISVSDIGGSVATDIQRMRGEMAVGGGVQQQSSQHERTGRRVEFRGEIGQQRM
jgi:hypothetical protein